MYSFHLGLTGTLVYKLGIFTLAKLEVLELLKRSEKPNKSRCAITFHLVRSKVTAWFRVDHKLWSIILLSKFKLIMISECLKHPQVDHFVK